MSLKAMADNVRAERQRTEAAAPAQRAENRRYWQARERENKRRAWERLEQEIRDLIEADPDYRRIVTCGP